MKITSCRTYVVKLPPRREHNWATKMRTPIGQHVLVRLQTDAGLCGWGEAPAIATWGGPHMAYYGETATTVVHLVADYLFPVIDGADPTQIGPLHERMDGVVKGHPYAKAALDQALYDIAGQALGVPVSTLLGGAHRDRIPVAHSLGIMDNAAAVAEAEAACAEGIRTIKVKCGVDAGRDVQLVRDLRRALGPDVAIRVDANEGWGTVDQAVRVIHAMSEYGIAFAEQPVVDLDDTAEIARRVSVPLMVDELAWTPRDILAIRERRAAQLISLYVTKPGGLFRAIDVGRLTGTCGLRCDIGGSVEMGVGNAANLHLGAAVEVGGLASVCPVSAPEGAGQTRIAGVYYLDDIVAEPFGYADGCVLVPQGPGLGVHVDEKRLRRYAL